MNIYSNNNEYNDVKATQSFYEPALKILNELFEIRKQNLRKKGYDENNAMVSKVDFTQELARRFRITQWNAQRIIASLINSNNVFSTGGYIQPLESKQ